MEYIKEIFAKYDKKCIRVYQAYNSTIASEALALQTFGDNFSLNRMTWIKPSFLWLMYRSNWGTKKNQECILALDIYRDRFNNLLEKAVLTSPDSILFDGNQWEKAFSDTDVYCQWDPDRNINGNPINRAAIQIGLKGSTLREFLDTAIYSIEDITQSVRKWNEQRKKGRLNTKELPSECIYPVRDKTIRRRLDMI
ncbi:MAG: DUF4291 domain-containing protein [Ruminococcus sp.]|nr:DUF4291 domain-containing protein [Ruminococcus sp.]MDE7226674.1 DUF4291 domain-containing protein [Ruminococcus sp.]